MTKSKWDKKYEPHVLRLYQCLGILFIGCLVGYFVGSSKPPRVVYREVENLPDTPDRRLVRVIPQDFFDAISIVEIGRYASMPNYDQQVGRGSHGELGPYCLTEQYVLDVNRILRQQGDSRFFSYSDRAGILRSEEMMCIYWSYYATEERLGRKSTYEDLARIHNGGPLGHLKDSTIPYWNKIQNNWKGVD